MTFYLDLEALFSLISVALWIGLVCAFIVLTKPQQNPQELITLTGP